MESGMDSSSVSAALKQYGYNELPSSKPKTIFRIALETFREPMFLLLISCATLYIILGDYREGMVLLSTTLVIIFITFFQYSKTERALEALKNLSSPRALVIRDGTEKRIPGREVVPGDLLILNEGDRVPADATLLEATAMTVDESMLTGESIAVSKTIASNEIDPQGKIFSGTLVVNGRGMAKVHATGLLTQFGKIGSSLQEIEDQGTRMQSEMKKLIRNLFLMSIMISVAVVLAFYFSRGNLVQSLLNGLASAMAILPEEFPVVLTVFLALGAWRLSGNKVLTRKPSAIESLGSATVLCTDKTGTITQNRMEVVTLYNGQTFHHKSDGQALTDDFKKVVTIAQLASVNHSIDPMEKAIGRLYQKNTLGESSGSIIREYPLSRDLLSMTHVYQSGETCMAAAKGAPEAIFKLCRMDENQMQHHMAAVQSMGEKGIRVLGVAHANAMGSALPDRQDGFEFVFVGLIGFEDPIRPEVPAAIRECREAGIRVIMITGDFPVTARNIGAQIGLDHNLEIMTGQELEAMDDITLQQRINGVSIFARVKPEHKLRIVQALKANNEVVAMTGDGVNDAPALKAAAIGIAMGEKGTDVAREVSSLVLLDDNFASIVAAIRSGRRIFDNLQKAMSYILAVHVPIIGLTLLPALFGNMPIIMMPLHIVFLELIIDPVCSVAFESEHAEQGIMQRPPRDPKEMFFGTTKILKSLGKGLLLFVMVMAVYALSVHEQHTENEIRAISFSTLIIGNVFFIMSSLSNTRGIGSIFRKKNKAAILILFAALALLMMTLAIPGLQKIFAFSYPGWQHFGSAFIASILLLMLLECFKWLGKKKIVRIVTNRKS